MSALEAGWAATLAEFAVRMASWGAAVTGCVWFLQVVASGVRWCRRRARASDQPQPTGGRLGAVGTGDLAGDEEASDQVKARTPSRAVGDRLLATELDRLRSTKTRSLAVVVIDNHSEGAARVRSAFIDAHADTVFEVGSLSKAITGLLIADAADRGELAVDSPLDRYLPELATTRIGSRTTTDLCTHTSGLPRMPRTPAMWWRLIKSAFGRNPYQGLDRPYVIQEAGRARLRPGYRYSNLGGALAGQVVSAAGGLDFEDLVRVRLFEPLSMHSSTARPAKTLAPGWDLTGDRPQAWPMDGFAPAGGIVSTAHDLTLLALSMLAGTTPGLQATESVDDEHGLFWVVRRPPGIDRRLVWHNGQTGGYSCHFEVYLEARRAAFAMANLADADDLQRLIDELSRLFLA